MGVGGRLNTQMTRRLPLTSCCAAPALGPLTSQKWAWQKRKQKASPPNRQTKTRKQSYRITGSGRPGPPTQDFTHWLYDLRQVA